MTWTRRPRLAASRSTRCFAWPVTVLTAAIDARASPLKPREIILGKVTPYVFLSLVNALTIILLGFLVFDVPVRGSIWLLLLECMLYITLALSLGVLISTSARTMQMAMFMSMLGLMLPTILLSGFIFPIDASAKICYLSVNFYSFNQ